MIDKYEDIINLKAYEPKYHVRMSQMDRAAQFSPFQALTGYSAAIKETARLTSKKIELNDEEKEIINNKLQYINLNKNNEYTLIYFIKDELKSGGEYKKIKTKIKKIDIYNQLIILYDNKKILIDDIIDIDIY